MKILLFATSIKDTFDNGNYLDYKNLVDILEKIRILNNNDIAFISFCDNTENKNIMLFHARKLIDHTIKKKVFFGEQFLGDVYYSGLDGGAIMYNDKKMDKLDKIIKYAKKIESNGNEVELIIADGNMDVDEYKERIKKELSCPCSLIYNVSNVSEINETLNELYNIKEKKLQLNN